MPRTARYVVPDVPHHVTQRGNRKSQIFYSDADFRTYLAWLSQDARRCRLDVLAYCLMSNHVHFVVVPGLRSSIAQVLQHVHMLYAQRLNRLRCLSGHAWQGRFFSAPLDETHLWRAIRYVERNPVRAGLVTRAEDYPWSSARAHCEATRDPVLTDNEGWSRRRNAIGNWSVWLAEAERAPELDAIRARTRRGAPCGSEQFVKQLESVAGRPLQWRRRGRPRKSG